MNRLVLCLACCLLPAAARADVQPARVQRPRAQDNHAFRFVLAGLGLQPISLDELLAADPTETALIVLGNASVLDTAGLREYLRTGGSLLLATDQKTQFQGIQVHGEVVEAVEASDMYKDSPDCPLVTDFDQRQPLFQGVHAIATNRPGFLSPADKFSALAWRELAWFPRKHQIPSARVQARRPFAMAHEEAGGRWLVLSDHSVFINSMMLQDDNDNFTFAYNCIRWVTEGSRKRVLVFDDGWEITSFDVAVKEVPAMLPDHPVAIINSLLTRWERENIHNELLLERYSVNQIMSAAAIALTVALLAYGFYRMQQARQRLDDEITPG